ncbi:alpha/beta hydrolase family protein [Prochlorococcus sp. MIT 1300]|uniref:alpha/beta hydrolase family protein n=1 Tax=Prochlorococcus sp. MIT 1300 TaxID=3096218 RepID=UPI002A764062|nr:prolyl oligopeptidase family serine peptidase [Prochlorococcus sp. MIT 1300]
MSDLSYSKPFAQPLSAAVALSRTVVLKEPQLIGNWVLWLEQRPNEGGRTTALIRPWGLTASAGQELTPAPMNLRTRVHGYGGGVFAAESFENTLLLVWINNEDGCVWTQSWEGLTDSAHLQNPWLSPCEPSLRLSSPGKGLFADGLIDISRNRWIGVMEYEDKDFLVTLSLSARDQTPNALHFPRDFLGYAALSPDGGQLAWVEWQQPHMPWDASQLWWGEFDQLGALQNKRLLAGSGSGQNPIISQSVFQPFWSSQGELVVAEDSTGWWNLMISNEAIQPNKAPEWSKPWPMKGETAMPQWVYGMRTSAAAGEGLVAAVCKEGQWHLNLLTKDGHIHEIDQPFDDLSGINAQSSGRAIAIASNSFTGSGLLEIDLTTGNWDHSPMSPSVLAFSEVSLPESFWFEGFGGKLTHAWYYPPSNEVFSIPPLLVKSHSGPTGMARKGISLGIQFWTSRGWGVVDVNYGGSTGFGRSYRERLIGGWGEVDSFDCASAAEALIKEGKVDPDRIAIEGGSAAGFTTLGCLCFSEVFRVGACRYAVSDLTEMAKATHRFEAKYLESLVGPWPIASNLYESRSPLFNAHRIKCPVIFFQGLEDKVVPPTQTDDMASALIENDIPVEVHTYASEGHGFRNSNVQVKVLECTERFFNSHLDI